MKVQGFVKSDRALGDRFITKGRLDLNDLIKKRSLEKKIDLKSNLIIFSGVTIIAIVVFIIIIL